MRPCLTVSLAASDRSRRAMRAVGAQLTRRDAAPGDITRVGTRCHN